MIETREHLEANITWCCITLKQSVTLHNFSCNLFGFSYRVFAFHFS